MNQQDNNTASSYSRYFKEVGVLFCLATLFILPLNYIYAQQETPASNTALKGFYEHLNSYLKLREQSVKNLSKPSGKSEPEKIHAYETALEDNLRTARVNASRGEIFTPEVANHIRKVIRQEFKGQRLQELRKEVSESETKGMPLRVNYPYPEQKEMLEMPPTLLLKLPALPQQLRYRFVGSNLLLMDREARIILDYMPEALP